MKISRASIHNNKDLGAISGSNQDIKNYIQVDENVRLFPLQVNEMSPKKSIKSTFNTERKPVTSRNKQNSNLIKESGSSGKWKSQTRGTTKQQKRLIAKPKEQRTEQRTEQPLASSMILAYQPPIGTSLSNTNCPIMCAIISHL
jgi:hypothetical protein